MVHLIYMVQVKKTRLVPVPIIRYKSLMFGNDYNDFLPSDLMCDFFLS